MAPKLYQMDVSPPVRSVYFTEKALGLKLDYSHINLPEKDHLNPEYVKMNPQHTVPTLELEDGRVIWDSHAINIYLVSKYGKDDSLYPKDLYKRAVVDQRLHFDSGILFPLIRFIVRPMAYQGVKTIPQNLIDETNQAYEYLNTFLQGQQWVTPGDKPTIADFSILSSITSLDVFVPVAESKYPNVIAWIKRGEQLPYYKGANQKGLDEFRALVKKLLS